MTTDLGKGTVQTLKAYLQSERFTLKFCQESVKLHGFGCVVFLGRISNETP